MKEVKRKKRRKEREWIEGCKIKGGMKTSKRKKTKAERLKK